MNDIGLYGGIAGLLAFVLAMTRVLMHDRGWRDLLEEVRTELDACTDHKVELRTELEGLRNEVVILRTELHAVRWRKEAG